MGITALGIAMGYVIVIGTGAVVALLILVYLFGEAPGESKGAGREIVEGSFSLERSGEVSTSTASTRPELSEHEAA